MIETRHFFSPFKTITASFATILALSLGTHGQVTPWITLYDAPGHVVTATLNPFADLPHPSLFLGGASSRTPTGNPHSVEWIGPLDGAVPPASVVSDGSAGVSSKLGFDPATGFLYSVGSGSAGWLVQISADGIGLGGPGTWTSIDLPFAANGGSGSGASGFAADGLGNVFVCGWALDSGGYSRWIVRKRGLDGAWSTVRNWGASRKAYHPAQLHIAGGYLFVVGLVDNAWAVQRMNLANGAWDAPYTGAPKGKKAGAVAVTSRGTDIYVLAWAGGASAAPQSIVLLKSPSLGIGPWTTVRTFAESPQINRPSDLAFDIGGNLYVVGDSTFYTSAGTWNEAWIVRRCDATTGVWQSWTPLADNPALQRSFAQQVLTDPATGDLYVCGTAQDIVGGQLSPTWRAIVQRMAFQP